MVPLTSPEHAPAVARSVADEAGVGQPGRGRRGHRARGLLVPGQVTAREAHQGDRRPLPVLRRRPPQRDLRRHEGGSGEAVSVGRSHNLTGRAPFPAEGAQLAGWRVASSRRRRTAGEPLQKLSSCDPAFSHMSIPGSKTWARALKGTSTLAHLSRRFQQSRTSPIGVVWQKASSSMPNSFGRDVGAYPCQGVPP